MKREMQRYEVAGYLIGLWNTPIFTQRLYTEADARHFIACHSAKYRGLPIAYHIRAYDESGNIIYVYIQ